jgi:hypothetical protein
MRLEFTKMQGLGNDFVVIDATVAPVVLTPAQLRFIADRHFGVGCDQILMVESARSADTDFYYRIFNADGGEVEQCGNGARCFVRYVHERGLTQKTVIRVGTLGGIIEPRLEADGQVTVNMGAPVFEPARVPFRAPALQPLYDLLVNKKTIKINSLSMGNPHAVQVVPDVDTAPVASEGPLIEAHPDFPQPPACLRTWCRRNAGLRHGRLRRGGGRHPARTARLTRHGFDARRRPRYSMGRCRPAGIDDGACRDRIRWRRDVAAIDRMKPVTVKTSKESQ